VENRNTELLHEDWVTDLERKWVAYGSPKPVLVHRQPLGAAFLNNGDGYFPSGAYTPDRFEATGGLGASAVVSVPLTEPQWQRILVILTSDIDEEALATWGHEDGELPRAHTQRNDCYAEYPDGARYRGRDFVRWGTMQEQGAFAAPPTMQTGTAHTVTIQIFPDGTCGVAVDGHAQVRSESSLRLFEPFRLVLEGRSDQTEVLVGDVRLWTGINTEIDWGVLNER
jgi:hypothetical protein